MIYKCPNCQGALTYDPIKKGMHCKYCDNIYSMDELESEKEQDQPSHNSIDVYVYSCTSCGAELMVNHNEASTFCAYCGQPTVVFSRVSSELQPDYCIPFSITGEQAVELIRKKLRKGLFVPAEIKSVKIDKLRGIYIPFWLHDIKIRAKANINGTKGSGEHKHTVHFYRDAEATYTKITCDGSSKLNDELSQRLEPYNMGEIRKFEPEFLSGFYADRFDVTEKDTRNTALERAIEFLDEDIMDSVGSCNSKEFEDKNVRYEFLQHSYALFPAWFMTFWYQNELYTILVNGQTGKVIGNVPMSTKKLVRFVSLLAPSLIVAMSVLSNLYIKIAFGILDTDDAMKISFAIIAVIVSFMLYGVKSWKKYQNERKYFTESNTVSYVKERQDNEW